MHVKIMRSITTLGNVKYISKPRQNYYNHLMYIRKKYWILMSPHKKHNEFKFVFRWFEIELFSRIIFSWVPCQKQESRVGTNYYIPEILWGIITLSHTWVRYQGLSGRGLSVQYWPRWFKDFPAIWFAVPLGANGVHWIFCVCVWNKLFRGKNQIIPKDNLTCEFFMVTNCPFAGINKWMKKNNKFEIMELAETQL